MEQSKQKTRVPHSVSSPSRRTGHFVGSKRTARSWLVRGATERKDRQSGSETVAAAPELAELTPEAAEAALEAAETAEASLETATETALETTTAETLETTTE